MRLMPGLLNLLNDRVICVVFIVDDRLCRGHHDRLGQRAVGQIAAGKALDSMYCLTSAPIPAICGAAIEVPLMSS